MQTDDLEYFDSEEFRQLLKTYEDSAKSGHPVYMDADQARRRCGLSMK